MPFAKSSPYHRSRSQIETGSPNQPACGSRPQFQRRAGTHHSALAVDAGSPAGDGCRDGQSRRSAFALRRAHASRSYGRGRFLDHHGNAGRMRGLCRGAVSDTACAASPAPDETPRRRAADHLSLVSVHARCVRSASSRLAPVRQTDGDTFVQPEQQAQRVLAPLLFAAPSSPHAPCESAGPARGGRRLPNCAGSTTEPCATSACRPATSNTSHGTAWAANDGAVATDITALPRRQSRVGRVASSALCLSILLGGSAAAQTPPASDSAADNSVADQEPITPVPPPPPADPRKLALGERLFSDSRLSRAGNLSCNSCHDIHSNGARPDDWPCPAPVRHADRVQRRAEFPSELGRQFPDAVGPYRVVAGKSRQHEYQRRRGRRQTERRSGEWSDNSRPLTAAHPTATTFLMPS